MLVREADPAIELGVAREALFDAGHADQDDAHVVAVAIVADLLETGRFRTVGLVDDE